MKRQVVLMMAVMGCSVAFSATNTFTGAVNNQTQNSGNWTGALQDWDDAVVADWTTVRPSATAWVNMKYNTVTFNSEVNQATTTEFVWNTIGGAAPSTNYYRDHVTVNADVTKNVRLGGAIVADDGELSFVNNSPTAVFEAYGGIYSDVADMTYAGAAGAKFKFGGGAVNSSYAGSTVLDGIYADVIVNGTAVKGPFGVETNKVVIKNGATIEINEANRSIKNDVIVAAGETGTMIFGTGQHTFGLDVGGELTLQNGTRWINGTMSGTGTVNLVGGTVVFNNTAMDSDFSGTINATSISQARTSHQYGSATIVLPSGSNFRGFNDQAGETITITNEIEVATGAANQMARVASSGGANNSPHTVVSNVSFAADGILVLQATANNSSPADATTIEVTGIISDGANTGDVVIDNEWSGTSFPNGVVKLHGANTYTGTTTVEDGRVQLIGDASIDNSSEIIMMSDGILDLTSRTGGAYTYGGTFGGSGTVEGDLTLTGSLKLTMNSASEYDAIAGSGNLVLGDTIRFLDSGLTPADTGATFTVLPGWASISGTPANLISVSGCVWSFDAATGIATLTFVPVPTTDTVWTFNTDGDTEGWFDGNGHSTNMTTVGGVLTIEATTGIDPFLQLDTICDPDGENWYNVEIRARQLDTNGVPVAWAVGGCSAVVDHMLGDEGWTILGAIGSSGWITEAEASGEWYTFTYDLRSFSSNTFTGIRFDAIGNAPLGSSYEVDYIKLTRGEVNTVSTPVDTWEFDADGDVEGWTVNNATAVVGHTAAGGVMTCSATTGDPQWFYTGGVTKTSGLWDRIAFRARQLVGGTPSAWSGGGTVSVITGVANITPLDGSHAKVTRTDEADSWVVLELDISECSVDTINSIRLDFTGSPRTIEVDWVRAYSKEEGLEGYNGWAYGYNDLGDVSPSADPDGDGSDNYNEYLFGGDPSDGAVRFPAATIIDLGGGSNAVEYIYYQRDGMTYSMQGSMNMPYGWDPMVEGSDYEVVGSAVSGDQTVVTNHVPADVDAKFIRAQAQPE